MLGIRDIQGLIAAAIVLLFSGMMIGLDVLSLREAQQALRQVRSRHARLRVFAALLVGTMFLQGAWGVAAACILSPLRRWAPLSGLAHDPAVDTALHWGLMLAITAQACSLFLCVQLMPSVLPQGAHTTEPVRSKGYGLLAVFGLLAIPLVVIYWVLDDLGGGT